MTQIRSPARKRLGVAAGMAGGLTMTLAALSWTDLPAVGASLDARAIVWARCATITTLPLLLAIALLARHRFFSDADIDGASLSSPSPRAALLQAMLQNTLEQTVLASLAQAAWLLLGPADRHGLVLVCAGLFAIGRMLFFLGYSRGATARALGFTLTFYPSAGLLLLLIPRLF